jgi:hypothetical protein
LAKREREEIRSARMRLRTTSGRKEPIEKIAVARRGIPEFLASEHLEIVFQAYELWRFEQSSSC